MYLMENQPIKSIQQDKSKQKGFTNLEWFQFFSMLYIHYIQIYKNLEVSYDGTIHPQKQPMIKELLINCIDRILNLRRDLTLFNTYTSAINSDFVNFDEILNQLKLT